MTDRPRLTHISLFSGIGGDTLAAEWAGFETVLLCEIDPFCQRVLHKHWPDVPLIGDARDVTKETIVNAIGQSRSQEAEGRLDMEGELLSKARRNQNTNRTTAPVGKCGESRLTLLSAGVPCQPASTAGKRRGKADERWLWPQAIRVLSELKPTWATFENPAGIGSLGELGGLSEVGEDAAESVGDTEAVELDNICRDIEACGYEVQPVCIPACAVGAPHRRDRIFIIAYSKGERLQRSGGTRWAESNRLSKQVSGPDTNANGQGLQRHGESGERAGERLAGAEAWQEDWLTVASRLCAVDDGLSAGLVRHGRNANRTQKLKACGNAIVPAQIYSVFKAIADIELAAANGG